MQNIIRKFLGGLILVLCVSSCQAQNRQNSIIGKWYFNSFSPYELSSPVLIEVLEDKVIISLLGMGSLLGEEDDEIVTGYKYENNKYYIGADEDWLECTFIDNNTLKINYSWNNAEVTGKRINDNINTLTGKYFLTNDVGLFKSLEFIDKTNVKIVGGVSDFPGLNTKMATKYTISGTNLLIDNANGTSLVFEIIGDNIIKGDTTMGYGPLLSIIGVNEGISIFIKE